MAVGWASRQNGLRVAAQLLLLGASSLVLPLAANAAVGSAKPVASSPANLNSTGRDITLTVPLHATGPLGQVQITITKDSRVLVSEIDLVNALSRIVRPEDLAPLKKLANAAGQIPIADAAKAGFEISYDPSTIELSIQIAATARKTQDVSFGLGTSAGAVQPDLSAPVGLFLNYRVGEVYQATGVNKGNFDFLGDFELGGRIAQTVSLDNFASVDQNGVHPLVRSGSRLIYDMPGPALRFTLGDLATETTAFQTDPQISGINVSHLVSNFFPTFSTTSTSSQTLTLTRGSDVQLLVNNLPVSQIHLGPGTYNLRNFPLTQGANNVTAIITDDTGQRRVVNFNFFSDASLLSPGIAEYTGSVGILAPLGNVGPHYEANEPAFSGFYRRGLTEQITAGANLQADKEDQVFGADGVFGTKIGLFGVDIAGNHLRSGGAGAAARLEYRYADDTNTLYTGRTIDLSIEYRTEKFGDINSADPDNTDEAIFAANIVQPLTQDISLQVSGNYTKSREAGQDIGSASAFVTWQAPFETTLGVGATYEWAPRVTDGVESVLGRGFSLALTLTHRFDASTLVDATADRFQQRADFSRSPLQPLDDWFANGDVSHTNFGYTGDATVGYETNRGNVEAVYNTALNPDGSVATQQTGAFFDGSVDFAGGKFALGRHISDSFAIVSPHETLGDRQVIVDTPFGDQVVARSGALGPAVAPIASYNTQVIPYDVKDLPPGYNLGSGNFQVYPWLYSGFALTVGSAYNVTALGYLDDTDGKPLALTTGIAVSLDDPKAPHVEVITNRTGRFAAIGLAAGRWRITMNSVPTLTYELTIAKSQSMLVRAGTLKPGEPK